jgi:hypothetical protein
MGPLVKVAGFRRRWLSRVFAYTMAGIVSSALVGAIIGSTGRFASGLIRLPPDVLVAVLAGLLILVALSWPLPLPQVRRQTNGIWEKRLGPNLAAAAWGFDIGLTFSTWRMYSGAWALLGVAVSIGEPVVGAALFSSFWLGRALSSWLSPVLVTSAQGATQAMLDIQGDERMFRALHVVGLGLVIGFVLMVRQL